MGARAEQPHLADDGSHQPPAERGAADRRRAMAIQPDQTRLPDALPLAAEFSDARVAARPARRFRYGIAAWRLLPRVLLVPDGAPVCRRRHEPILDSRACRVR